MPSDASSNQQLGLRRGNAWFLPALVVIAVIGLALVSSQQISQLKTQLGTFTTAVQDLRIGIDQQGALVHRVIGSVVPVKIPEGAEQELAHIEGKLAAFETLLGTKDETKALSGELTQLVDRLPVWVQTELFPRILPLRWQLDALQLLQREAPKDVDDLQDLATDLSEHTLNRPNGVPDALEVQLLKRAEEVAKEAAKRDEVRAVQQATETLNQNFLDQIEAVRSDSAVFDRLTDPLLKERLAATLYNTAQELKLLALTSKLDDPKILSDLDALALAAKTRVQDVRKTAATQQAAVARKYQVWALDQLRDFPELKAINSRQVDEIQGTIARNNPLGNERKAALGNAQDELANALIMKLSIIDTRLLDDAVSEWYRKVFSSRFASLDDVHQLKVVEGFANSTKRAPEELP